VVVRNPSASFLRDGIQAGTFTWLVTEESLSEYNRVISRLGVRRNLVGEIIKMLKEEAEFVTIRREEEVSKIQTTVSCACAEQACGLYVEQETFPPRESGGQVISPVNQSQQPAGVAQPGASDVGGGVRFGRVRVAVFLVQSAIFDY
jgi:hypothetical protein